MAPDVLIEAAEVLRELLSEIRAFRSELRAMRLDSAGPRVSEMTPRKARGQHRRLLFRQLAQATPYDPVSWAAAAEIVLLLDGEHEPPAGCERTLERLRADPEVPRSQRRIFENLRQDAPAAADGTDGTDGLLRQWNARR